MFIVYRTIEFVGENLLDDTDYIIGVYDNRELAKNDLIKKLDELDYKYEVMDDNDYKYSVYLVDPEDVEWSCIGYSYKIVNVKLNLNEIQAKIK